MKRIVQTLAALAGLGVVVAVLIVGVGLYNVSARQGHVPGIAWLLHTTFKQSVRLRAPGPDAVPDDITAPDRIRLGQLHYRSACAFCHAEPDTVRHATALAMNPQPPHVTEAAADWQPQHLFWIVREGVKMSGMPHWPAKTREDEVWTVVAYLNAVAQENVPPEQDRSRRVGCTQCHGANGDTGNDYVPRLDRLTPDQIAQALTQYRGGTRASGIMEHAASALTDDAIAALAQKFGAAQPVVGTVPEIDTPAAGLAMRGTDDVPACTACHGPGRRADQAIAPILAGQGQPYLEQQLKLWRAGQRGGGQRAGLMRKAAQDLSDADIRALSHWYADLK